MLKTIQIIAIISLLVSKLTAQIGNEWINYNAEYVKISVAENGFYRVTAPDLDALGINTSNINPETFRLLRRGNSVSVSVTGVTDQTFNNTDYVEFFGYANDGFDEDSLFIKGRHNLRDYSLYTDTAAYFLTWDNGQSTFLDSNLVQVPMLTGGNITKELYTRYHDAVNNGPEYREYIYLTEGDLGEGFVGQWIRDGNYNNYNIAVDKDEIFDGSGTLELQFVGGRDGDKYLDIIVKSGNDSIVIQTDEFSYFNTIDVTVDLPIGFITQDVAVNVFLNTSSAGADFASMVKSKLTYTSKSQFSALNISDYSFFELGANSSQKLSFLNGEYSLYEVLDSTKNVFLGSYSSTYDLTNSSSLIKKYLIQKLNNFLTPSNIEKGDFQTIDYSTDYIIVTNNSLFESAEEVKKFKETELGGNRKVNILDIEKLYNTYTYGDKNPISIRRVVKDYMLNGAPEALFIIGRGYTATYSENGKGYNRHNPLAVEFVPTFGSPGSDLLFTKGLGTSNYEPFLATGRLSVESNEEVIMYLDKLKEHSLVTEQDSWVKNVLHLSGGSGQAEANYLFELINIYKNTAENQLMGANVDLFAKKTDSPVELYNISEKLNNGLSMITYIGHSSPYTIDMDLGSPTAINNGYDNQGKYPVLFLNGCRTANVFTFTHSPMLNNWVNAKERGGILGIGHSSYAYSNTLHQYTNLFYKVAFTDTNFYGKSIGEIQQETIRRYSVSSPEESTNYTQMTQQIILGDPDVKLVSPTKSDFFIKDNYAEILPYRENEDITTNSDSINLNFSIHNFGIVDLDSIEICITRTFGDTGVYSYAPFTIAAPGYDEEFTFTLNNNIEGSEGINNFEIFIDCEDTYIEYNEDNNKLNFEYLMPSNGVNLLYPYPYAIVGDRSINFVVESKDQSIDSSFYTFELAKDFDFKNIITRRTVKGSNVATFMKVNTNAIFDSTAFYWRSRLQDVPIGEDTVWQTSSFTYIKGKTGWGQFEYDQYIGDKLQNLIALDDLEKIDFDTLSVDITFKTIGGAFDGSQKGSTTINVNGNSLIEYLNGNCWQSGYVIVPFNGQTLQSYLGVNAYNVCGLAPGTVAHFPVAAQNNMKTFLDSIPVGDYIIMLSITDNPFNVLRDPILESLSEFGCNDIDTIATGLPYAFIGRKGNTEPLYQQIVMSDTIQLVGEYQIRELTTMGEISYDNIGPSVNWETWSWSFSEDSLELLNTELSYISQSIEENDSFINSIDLTSKIPNEMMKMTLSAQFNDPLSQSLSDLDYWAICYDIAPEGVVIPSVTGQDSFSSEDVFQGDTLGFEVAFMNVSPVDFDSVSISWSFRNLRTQLIDSGTVIVNPLLAYDTLIYKLNLPVPFQFGVNEFKLTFNPEIQVEQYYQNNSFTKYLTIIADEAAPVLEVYLNKDISSGIEVVSENPIVDYYIKDNNPSSTKQDTNNIEMYLSGPCVDLIECSETRIYFSDSLVSYYWTNSFFHSTLNFNSLSPGVYEFKVFGSDAFGNKNEEPGLIQFEVVSGSAISSFLPYPSPFSSEMRFAYTKIGDEQVDNIKIQILSSTGSLVMEVNQEELGMLKAGDNLTEWFWDGKDSRGGVLANGIYLYRVLINDDSIGHIPSSADDAFNKEWGTIMIAR